MQPWKLQYFIWQCNLSCFEKLDEDTLLAVFEGVPRFEVAKSVLDEGVKAVDLLLTMQPCLRRKEK